MPTETPFANQLYYLDYPPISIQIPNLLYVRNTDLAFLFSRLTNEEIRAYAVEVESLILFGIRKVLTVGKFKHVLYRTLIDMISEGRPLRTVFLSNIYPGLKEYWRQVTSSPKLNHTPKKLRYKMALTAKERYLKEVSEKRKCASYDDSAIILGKYRAENNGILDAKPYVDYGREISKYRPSDILLGLELEVEGVLKHSTVDKVLSLIGPGYTCYDGSLDSGIEYVLSPRSWLDWKNNRGTIRQGLKTLSSYGCRSHETTTCGLHLHVGYNSTFTIQHATLIRSFVCRSSHFFRALSRRLRGSGRRGDDPTYFCRFENDADSRYRAVNLQPLKTMELRFFRGTLKPESFFAAIECGFCLVDFAIAHKNDGLDLRKFRRFLASSNYGYLKAYVQKVAPVRVRTPARTLTEDEKRDRALRMERAKRERIEKFYRSLESARNGYTLRLRGIVDFSTIDESRVSEIPVVLVGTWSRWAINFARENNVKISVLTDTLNYLDGTEVFRINRRLNFGRESFACSLRRGGAFPTWNAMSAPGAIIETTLNHI